MLKNLTKIQLSLFIIIAAVTIAFRFIGLGDLPGGLNQDEASMGYDAFSLLEYGIDRNGIHNPVHMIAWGSGQNALLAYLSMPFIKVFGLNIYSIRLAPAILGCIAVFVIFLLCRRLNGTNFGLLTAALTAICPWHIMISRWALESNILPVFMLTSVYFLTKATEDNRFLPLSFLFFGISLYAYAPSYLVIPLFLFSAGIYCLAFRVFSLKMMTVSVVILGLTALPIFAFVVINTFKLPAFESSFFSMPRYTGSPRYTHMSSIYSGNFLQETLLNLSQSIRILFIDFNDFETQNSAPNVGYLPKSSLPLILGGLILCIWQVIRAKRFTPLYFIVFWFFCSFIVSGTSSPAIHRMNTIVFPIIIFCAYGLYELLKYSKPLSLAFCILFTVSTVNFVTVYSGEYAKQVSSFFFEGYGKAVEDAYQHLIEGEKLYASDALNQPYIATLFHLKYDPNAYLKTVKFSNPDGAFQAVENYGNIVFGVRTQAAKQAKIVVIRKGDDAKHYNLNNYITHEYHDYLALYSKEVFREDTNGKLIRDKSLLNISSASFDNDFLVIKAEWTPKANILIEAFELYGSKAKSIPFEQAKNNRSIYINKSDLYEGSNKLILTATSNRGRKKIIATVISNFGNSTNNLLDYLETSSQDIGTTKHNKAYTADDLTVDGVLFNSGLGTHASSSHTFRVPKHAEKLNISYGISDYSGGCGDGISIAIYTDNKEIFHRKIAHNSVYSNQFKIIGVETIELRSQFGGNRHCDHLNWMSGEILLDNK